MAHKLDGTWSHSKYQLYKQCPQKFKYIHIDKLKEPKAPALVRGIKIHQDGEDYLNRKIANVPFSYTSLHNDIRTLRAHKACAELSIGVNNKWGDVGFFHPKVWCRLKIDAMYKVDDDTVKVIDFKTGKIREGYEEQLELYAAVVLSVYEVDKVETELWYVDHGVIKGRDEKDRSWFKYDLGDLPRLKSLWLQRVTPMLNDNEFAPTMNQYCKWCYFRSDNDGPCTMF